MGTTFEFMMAGCEQSYASQAALPVFREIDRLEGLFSRFNPTSEISQVNKLRPGQTLQVGLETYECLMAAEQVRTETGGAFDINFRAKTGFDVVRSAGGFLIKAKEAKGQEGAAGLDLDLGGIGKGYALDMAMAILDDWSIERALIHAGTSTAKAGGDAPDLAQEERGWPVGVGGLSAPPDAPKRVLLRQRALSGSGTEVKGRHIIDPRSGHPAEGHQAAWASHTSAAISDALSTAFLVMSTEEVSAYCRRHSDVWALLILADGSCRIFNPHIFPDPHPSKPPFPFFSGSFIK